MGKCMSTPRKQINTEQSPFSCKHFHQNRIKISNNYHEPTNKTSSSKLTPFNLPKYYPQHYKYRSNIGDRSNKPSKEYRSRLLLKSREKRENDKEVKDINAAEMFPVSNNKERDSWTIGTVILIFITEHNKWIVGTIMTITKQYGSPDLITVEYDTGNGNMSTITRNRNDKTAIKSDYTFLVNRSRLTASCTIELNLTNTNHWIPAYIESVSENDNFTVYHANRSHKVRHSRWDKQIRASEALLNLTINARIDVFVLNGIKGIWRKGKITEILSRKYYESSRLDIFKVIYKIKNKWYYRYLHQFSASIMLNKDENDCIDKKQIDNDEPVEDPTDSEYFSLLVEGWLRENEMKRLYYDVLNLLFDHIGECYNLIMWLESHYWSSLMNETRNKEENGEDVHSEPSDIKQITLKTPMDEERSIAHPSQYDTFKNNEEKEEKDGIPIKPDNVHSDPSDIKQMIQQQNKQIYSNNSAKSTKHIKISLKPVDEEKVMTHFEYKQQNENNDTFKLDINAIEFVPNTIVNKRISHKYKFNALELAAKTIQISHKLTKQIIPSMIKENISDIYQYINILTAIGCDTQYNDGGIRIFHYDFHDKQSNVILYCIAKKQDPTMHRGYEWGMIETLFTATEIQQKYNISIHKLPLSSRRFIKQINYRKHVESLINSRERHNIINTTQWHKIDVFGTENKLKNKQRLILKMSKQRFKEQLRIVSNDNNNNNNNRLLSILVFNNNKYWIEYVWIIKMVNNHFGISLKLNNKLQVTSIHLNKKFIQNRHELIDPLHFCQCLEDYESKIDRIYIGNPDDDKNKIQALTKNHSELKTKYKMLKSENNKLKEENFRLKQFHQANVAIVWQQNMM